MAGQDYPDILDITINISSGGIILELFISGYGGENIPSIGVFDVSNKGTPKLIWESFIINSSYLSIEEGYLFGISELEENSYVHMFKQQQEGYSHIDTKLIKGGLLCHISYLPKNKVLAGACYETGEIFTVSVGEVGFGAFKSFIKQRKGVELTRAHCVVPNKTETILYSTNIALDIIYSYEIHQGELFENGYLKLPKGEGPRHIQISENEEILYVITEYSNKIHIINNANGKMTLIDSVNTLPEGFCGTSYCSTLCLSKNGRFMYAANRGANTIAVFKVLEDSRISKIGDCTCFGNWPRHITLVNQDKYLAIANQESNEVVLCEVDSRTGLLTKARTIIEFNKPSFIYEEVGI